MTEGTEPDREESGSSRAGLTNHEQKDVDNLLERAEARSEIAMREKPAIPNVPNSPHSDWRLARSRSGRSGRRADGRLS